MDRQSQCLAEQKGGKAVQNLQVQNSSFKLKVDLSIGLKLDFSI